jgi:hypothetical protein
VVVTALILFLEILQPLAEAAEVLVAQVPVMLVDLVVAEATKALAVLEPQAKETLAVLVFILEQVTIKMVAVVAQVLLERLAVALAETMLAVMEVPVLFQAYLEMLNFMLAVVVDQLDSLLHYPVLAVAAAAEMLPMQPSVRHLG